MSTAEKYYLSVTGLVEKPFIYTAADLRHFKTYTAFFHGIPLPGISVRALLEIACIQHNKNHAHSVCIKSRRETIFLSVSEIMNSEYTEYLVAISLEQDGCNSQTGRISDCQQSTQEREIHLPCLVIHDGRIIQGIGSIEVTKYAEMGNGGKLLVIGVGPGDSALLTLQSISAMASADCFVASPDITERFASFITDKPVLYDPLECTIRYMAKRNPDKTPEEVRELVNLNRKHYGEMIIRELNSGRIIGFLDYGDPAVYGSWSYWIPDAVDYKKIKVYPAISAFNAGNAMIGKNVMYSGSAVITTPEGITANPGLMEIAAEHGDMVIIFVGLHDIEKLIPQLVRCYHPDTPVAITYKAGYEADGFVLKADIGTISEKIKEHDEKHLALIYIGQCAGDGPVEFRR